MKRLARSLVPALWLGLALPTFGQPDPHAGHAMAQPDPHAGHSAPDAPAVRPPPEPTEHAAHGDAPAVPAPPPGIARSGPEHAADLLFDPGEMAAARAQLHREHGGFTTHLLLADRFETGTGDGRDAYRWDLQGWAGRDLHRFWWKSEGGGDPGQNPDDFEVQALYSRALTPFFDLQAGLRYDARPTPQRTHAVIGIQGLLPYVFEIDAAVFLSGEGDWTGRFEAEYDLRIRQRLVLQPRLELNFSAQAIPELGLGAGLGSSAAGLRLRYEIRREIAPYIGLEWTRLEGATAGFARSTGRETSGRQAVLGLRAWF